ncbi:SAM-dependent methyltransferase [Kutzneria chonburiensis]|uniref:SAM-dependent methyltransferase n=1 Tax=Kutzneria chonburiensis TaxID=1483604 RepID=A0ABV6MLU2_9PSEU|nr:SAM-dependent methyltransferase [Kutzneria chonburiensis]
MNGDLSWVPPEVDPTIPHPARVYDYWLGGASNFAADRELAEKINKMMPGVPQAARFNRAFLRRAAIFMVRSGVRQFLDVGSGLPTSGNLHEIVQQQDPSCRVVYVDRDPIAVAHSELLLRGNDNAAVVHADARDHANILGSDEVKRLLDFSQPVGLFMLLLLHFMPDEWDPAGVVAGYRDAIPSGSYFAASHVAADGDVRNLGDAVKVYDQNTHNQPFPRTHAEVLRFFDGFDLVEPGVVGCPMWRPDGMGGISDDPGINSLPYAGVAIKP